MSSVFFYFSSVFFVCVFHLELWFSIIYCCSLKVLFFFFSVEICQYIRERKVELSLLDVGSGEAGERGLGYLLWQQLALPSPICEPLILDGERLLALAPERLRVGGNCLLCNNSPSRHTSFI